MPSCAQYCFSFLSINAPEKADGHALLPMREGCSDGGCILVVLACILLAVRSHTMYQTNVLLIMFDDLRPELSVYGKEHMITPNFERLAAKSVIFDQAYTPIAVCNPARDSILTGLRPDFLQNYGFQNSWRPHLLLPVRMKRAGYYTAGYGKILHHDGPNHEMWDEHFGNQNDAWYNYQSYEWDNMNSSLMPDKYKPSDSYPDYIYTTKLIKKLKKMSGNNKKYFFAAIGFKMPHLALHLPMDYLNVYRNISEYAFKATSEMLTYPPTSPVCAYQCCADWEFRYMNSGDEGSKHNESVKLQNMSQTLPNRMRKELLWGYSGMISYLDAQLGRILDVIDELDLWSNLTVILSSDHGMHNGEKGLWEKWTLFDESTRVPLMIHHPLSPYKGKHYQEPVETIDLFKTINDLSMAPFNKKQTYFSKGSRFNRPVVPLQGKSLALVVLGPKLYTFKSPHNFLNSNKTNDITSKNIKFQSNSLPLLDHAFAISQKWKCVAIDKDGYDPRVASDKNRDRNSHWTECDMTNTTKRFDENSYMGYSLRTRDYRYTAWIPFDREKLIPFWDREIKYQELYDHSTERLGDLGKFELVNLAVIVHNRSAKMPDKNGAKYTSIIADLRKQLFNFLKFENVYKSEYYIKKTVRGYFLS